MILKRLYEDMILGKISEMMYNEISKEYEIELKSYIKYLNQNDAPDNLRIGTKIEIYEMGKPVASGEIIANSNMKF